MPSLSLTQRTSVLGACLALALIGCSEKVEGPAPTVGSVTTARGSNVICTCDDLQGCERPETETFSINGSGFAPLPVRLLKDDRAMELPNVVMRLGAEEFLVYGDDPAKNTTGAQLTFITPAELQVTLPAAYIAVMPAGKYTVAVTNPNGQSAELAEALEVVVGPSLEKVEPTMICVDAAQTTVTLTGQNFRAGVKVTVGTQELPDADVTFVDANKIQAVVRKGLEVGSYDVTVTNPEGCYSTLSKALTVNPPPTLTQVAPPLTCSNGEITLTGTGFLPGATVTIGTTTVPTVAADVTPTEIKVNVGPIPPGGPFDVTVNNPDGCSSAVLPAALTVTLGPVIVAVDPSTVYNKVNFPIAIFGSGFKDDATVALGTSPPTPLSDVVVAASGDRIDAIVPANVPVGTYSLTVTTGGCSYTFPTAIEVIDQLTVVICGIDPPFGYDGEKTPVTITSGTAGTAGCSTGSKSFESTPRAWLDVGGTLKALRSVGFVTPTSLTGTVEAGLTVGGPYDLLVQNPSGDIGLLPAAFEVVDQPVPLVETINPSSVTTQYTGNLVITGQHFRSPVTVEAIDQAGTAIELTSPTVDSPTQITAGLNVGTLGLVVGAYVIRVTNDDQGTYSDFSALAVTNPAGNLGAWQSSGQMKTARRGHALVSGRVSSAARFLYAIGGDSGGGTPTLFDSVELVPLDKFGNTGTWVLQRYKLPAARAGLEAFVRGRFLYAVGGNTAAGPVQTVSRAEILDPADAPEVTSFTFSLGGTLQKGAWYYRVSANMLAGDPTNPSGETLPSDVVVVQAIDDVKVTLTWTAVTGAASYNVYRTPTANGTFGGEQLLADNLSCATPTCTYEDAGGAIKDATQTPLPTGATGVFVEQGIEQLKVARSDASLAVAPDPTGALFVYLAGGRSDATTVEDTVEFAPISADGSTLGAFTVAGNAMDSAREKGLLVVGEHETSPKVPAATSYLFAAGGITATVPIGDGASSLLGAGGAPGAFAAVAATKSVPVDAVGYMVNDTFYYFGGSANGTTAIAGASSCVFTTPPAFQNCNSLATGQLPSARMGAGLALESAYFYISGGATSSTAAAIADVIKTIY